jgi:hypothetical protein
MNGIRVIGLVVLILGILGLAYGSFTFTEETHDAQLGPIEVSVKDKKTVNIPVWAGIVAIAAGGALLAFGGKRGALGRA